MKRQSLLTRGWSKHGAFKLSVFAFAWLAALNGPSLCLAAQNVVVILDDSGSMGERMRSQRRVTRMQAAKQALLTVLEQLPDDAHVGVAMLNQRTRDDSPWIIPLGPVELERAREAIADVDAEGGTPLGAFLKLGADALLEKRKAEHYGSFRLLVVTDGEANDRSLLESYLPDVLARGIVVDVIGVDMASDHSLATKVNSYRRADDAESLTVAIQEVFAETSGQATDAGADDFAMLEGVPTEVAAAALSALAESGNQPIAAAEGRSRRGSGASQPGGTPTGKSTERRFPWLVAFIVIYVMISILRSAMKRRR